MPAPLTVPLSLLDRSRTREGEPPGQALHATVARARRAERLGYRRFWVAEHHAVPGIASGSPPVLMAAVAARTDHIRVGSGGVMLPNHAPLVVAEQAAMLEALHPGRIDLGVGRSLGFTAPVRDALGARSAETDDFAADLGRLLDLLHGRGPVTAMPPLPDAPPVFVLATGEGLSVAARLGLPVVVGGPMLFGDASALAQYRQDFTPGPALAEPYVMASLEIMVAASAERARDLLLPEAWAMADSRSTGAFGPLQSRATLAAREPTPRQHRSIERSLATAVHGTTEEVRAQLTALVERTGADEVLAATSTFDHEELAEADAALAALFGEPAQAR